MTIPSPMARAWADTLDPTPRTPEDVRGELERILYMLSLDAVPSERVTAWLRERLSACVEALNAEELDPADQHRELDPEQVARLARDRFAFADERAWKAFRRRHGFPPPRRRGSRWLS